MSFFEPLASCAAAKAVDPETEDAALPTSSTEYRPRAEPGVAASFEKPGMKWGST